MAERSKDEDLVFKAYKAQIPPKWIQFADAGSGAKCKWSRSIPASTNTNSNAGGGGGAKGTTSTTSPHRSAVGVPDATFNPHSRLAHLVRGEDRTLKDIKDIHYARFLFGPEKKVSLDDLIETSSSGGGSSDDEATAARREARRRLKQSVRRMASRGGSNANAAGGARRSRNGSVLGGASETATTNNLLQEAEAKSLEDMTSGNGGGGARRKKKQSWAEEMKAYIAKVKVRRDAKDRTRHLENILRHRQREAANRREREVERFAGNVRTAGPANANDSTATAGGVGANNSNSNNSSQQQQQSRRRNYQSMRAEDEVKANWYHGLVCSAQSLEAEAVRERLNDHYEARQSRRDEEARGNFEKRAAQSKMAENAKRFRTKRLQMAHDAKMLSANLGAQQAQIDFKKRIRDEQKRSNQRRAEHAERKAAIDLENHNTSVLRTQKALGKFHDCLERREQLESEHDAKIAEEQRAAHERLLLRDLKREEAAEERYHRDFGGGGDVKEGESKRDIRLAHLNAIEDGKLSKIAAKQGKANQNYNLMVRERHDATAKHVATEAARHTAAQRRLIAQHAERAHREEEIMDKYETIKSYGQRSVPSVIIEAEALLHQQNASAGGGDGVDLSREQRHQLARQNEVLKLQYSRRGVGLNQTSFIAPSSTGLHNSTIDDRGDSSLAFNKDTTSAVNNRLAEHQKRSMEMADDLECYYVERSEALHARDEAFKRKMAEESARKAAEAADRAAKHKAKCDAADERKQQIEEKILTATEKKDADLNKRLHMKERVEKAQRQAAAAQLNERTLASLHKVNVEKHNQLVEGITAKQKAHAERRAVHDAEVAVAKEAKTKEKLSRVEHLKRQVEEAAQSRDAYFEAIAEEKKHRSQVASFAREDQHEDLQARLAEYTSAVDAQRVKQRAAEEHHFLEKTAEISNRYDAEQQRNEQQRALLQRRWAEKNRDIEQSTAKYNASRLDQIKKKNEHTISAFINRSAGTPSPYHHPSGLNTSSGSSSLPPTRRAASSMQ